jgi:plasmid stabilization system protein ParE
MVRLTSGAEEQRDRLLSYYKQKKYYEAGQYLLGAVDKAIEYIGLNPNGGKTHPTSYPQVKIYGYRWVKVHIYWFSWAVVDDDLVITNILWERGDIPNTTLDE